MDSVIPFGNPDGARTEVNEALSEFVVLPPEWGAIAMPADDLQGRVIVGGKGAGKTAYLRRIYQHALKRNDLFAARLELSPPPTEHIRTLHLSADGPMWKQFWRAAILGSVATEVLFSEQLKGQPPVLAMRELKRMYNQLTVKEAPGYRAGPYLHLTWIATGFQTPAQRRAHALQAEWYALIDCLGTALAHLPPIVVCLDCLDDELHEAPLEWSACQRGLFEAVMDLMQDPRLGNRLHVMITLRDIVYQQILGGPHAMKFRDGASIRDLAWSYDAAQFFLQSKVTRLPSELCASKRSGTALSRWLGFQQVTSEDVAAYILRHTRLLPRDIVQIGNAVCKTIRQRRLLETPEILPIPVFRTVVKDVAKSIVSEQLQFCAMALLGQLPSRSRHVDTNAASVRLEEMLRKLRKDRFSREELEHNSAEVREALGCSESEILNAMWQNGLIGFPAPVDGGPNHRFSSRVDRHDLQFPVTAQETLVHPLLVDYLGLERDRTHPITLGW